MPVSSPSTPSVSSTTLAKLLALDEDLEKPCSASALWAAVSTLPHSAISRQPGLRLTPLSPALTKEAQPGANQAPSSCRSSYSSLFASTTVLWLWVGLSA